MLTEKSMWEWVSSFPSPIPANYIGNPLLNRIITILRIIDRLQRIIGVSEYEMTMSSIKSELDQSGDIVDESAIYRYLRKLITNEFLVSNIKSIRIYTKLAHVPIIPGNLPQIFVEDEYGAAIPPSEISNLTIFSDKGEKTIKMYNITEKGMRFLESLNTNRDDRDGES